MGHLTLVTAGAVLLAVDLVERRVRWSRNLTAVTPGRLIMSSRLSEFGSIDMGRPDGQLQFFGLACAPDLSAVYVQTAAGLTALDPATGAIRWQRTDVPAAYSIFRSESHLFLAEYYRPLEAVCAIRSLRVEDGAAVPVPNQEAAIEMFRQAQRFVDGCILPFPVMNPGGC